MMKPIGNRMDGKHILAYMGFVGLVRHIGDTFVQLNCTSTPIILYLLFHKFVFHLSFRSIVVTFMVNIVGRMEECRHLHIPLNLCQVYEFFLFFLNFFLYSLSLSLYFIHSYTHEQQEIKFVTVVLACQWHRLFFYNIVFW